MINLGNPAFKSQQPLPLKPLAQLLGPQQTCGGQKLAGSWLQAREGSLGFESAPGKDITGFNFAKLEEK